jgi:hypothetical protein
MWFRHSAAIALAVLLSWSPNPVASQRVRFPEPPLPAVAIASGGGLLRPLAAYEAGRWTLLEWPERSVLDDTSQAPPLPATLERIPAAWIRPLRTVPTGWRLRLLNQSMREVAAVATARWDVGMNESVALRFDTPIDGLREGDVAGIAVSGAIEALPVQHLTESSHEWRQLVNAAADSFAAVERKRVPGANDRSRSKATLVAELLTAEVSLDVITISGSAAYLYTEAIIWGRPTKADKGANCDYSSSEFHALFRRADGQPPATKWISGGRLPCGALTEGMTVLGAVRPRGGPVSLVVQYGGDDWQDFAIVDPAGPEDKIRRGPVPR